MFTSENRHHRVSVLALSSVSAIAIVTYFAAIGSVAAQTVINDGNNVTVTSAADGETIDVAAGVISTVDNAPVVVVASDDVTLENEGTLRTTGLTQAVQVNQAAQRGTINNAATGSVEGASRAINIQNTGLVVNNTGRIVGTGNQPTSVMVPSMRTQQRRVLR